MAPGGAHLRYRDRSRHVHEAGLSGFSFTGHPSKWYGGAQDERCKQIHPLTGEDLTSQDRAMLRAAGTRSLYVDYMKRDYVMIIQAHAAHFSNIVVCNGRNVSVAVLHCSRILRE